MALDPTRIVRNTSAGSQVADVSDHWIASQLDIPLWTTEGDTHLTAALSRLGTTPTMIFDTDFATRRTYLSLDLEQKIADAKGAPYGVMIGAGIAVLGLLWMYNQPSKGFSGVRSRRKRGLGNTPDRDACIDILDAWWEHKAEGMKPSASLTAKAKACAKAHNLKVRGL